jgi:hypothetical protein
MLLQKMRVQAQHYISLQIFSFDLAKNYMGTLVTIGLGFH